MPSDATSQQLNVQQDIRNRMNLEEFIILALIGIAAGIFSGMVGLGGGLIMIPAMIYFLGMNQISAQGTSLAVMLPPIGILAALNYYKSGQINIKYALIIAIAFSVGGYFGSKIALNLPVATIRKVFAFALIAIALRMLIKN
jgi:uncharacterized protein